MTEHDEQVGLFNILRLYENRYTLLKWIHAIPNGGMRNIVVAKKMKSEGVKSGVWDIFVPVAVDGWSGMYIEMKWKKNTLTDNQKEFQDDVGNTYKWAVCYNAIDAAHVIGEYLDIQELREVI